MFSRSYEYALRNDTTAFEPLKQFYGGQTDATNQNSQEFAFCLEWNNDGRG